MNLRPYNSPGPAPQAALRLSDRYGSIDERVRFKVHPRYRALDLRNGTADITNGETALTLARAPVR